jgi:hypothetical protein
MMAYLLMRIPHGNVFEEQVSTHSDYDHAIDRMTTEVSKEKERLRALIPVQELYSMWDSTRDYKKIANLIPLSAIRQMGKTSTIFRAVEEAHNKFECQKYDDWYKVYLINAPILGYEVYPHGSLESRGHIQEHCYYIENPKKKKFTG